MTHPLIVHSPEEVVWKWTLPVEDTWAISCPAGTRFLHHAELVGGDLDRDLSVEVWGVVHPDNPLVQRTFHLRGTGHRMNEIVGAGYVATCRTVLHSTMPFVIHVFITPGEEPIK